MSHFCKFAPLALAVCLATWAPAIAQESEEADAPQVLTSDLAPRTLLQEGEDRITADFVIVDSDNVIEVRINGEAQTIEPGPTVVVSREFRFTRRSTRIEVTAVDEAGNARTVGFLVVKPGEAPAEAPIDWYAQVGASYEIDDNPSNDLSTPIDIGVEVEGVVPDSEQQDNRLTLRGVVGLLGPWWNAYLGALQQTYGKSDNENFETMMYFLGGGVRSGSQSENSWVLRYQFADINLGEFDYSQQHTLTPGYEIVSQDSEGTERDFFALDVIHKNFAESAADDVTQFTLKWNTRWRDAANMDAYRNSLRLGQSSEGFEETEFNFAVLDVDWRWRWDGGFRFETGFGYEYRDYPNDEPLTEDTPLGDTRVDNLLRISLGPGWNFTDDIFARVGYRYLTNLSNKSPYVRQIYGVTVQATF